jgi:hypothetical protein
MGKYDRFNAVQVRIQKDKVTLRFGVYKKGRLLCDNKVRRWVSAHSIPNP